MPDWSYQTVFQRLLFRLPSEQSRKLALFGIGTIGRLPLGKKVIDYMGHMVPSRKLQVSRHALNFPSQVGLCCGVDPNMQAFESFGQFGFGFIEIGPVARNPKVAGAITRDVQQQSIKLLDPEPALSLKAAALQLRPIPTESQTGRASRPVRILRLAKHCDAKESIEIVEQLRNCVDAFVLPENPAIRDALLQRFGEPDGEGRRLAFLTPISGDDETDAAVELLDHYPIAGIRIDGTREADGRTMSPEALPTAIELTQAIRDATKADVLIVAAGGVHEPGDALRLKQAGADLVGLDSGFVFTGPGLPKRVNEAMLNSLPPEPITHHDDEPPAARQSWFWALLMGIAMLIGGVMAIVMALTRVVLPYDERFLGITRAELLRINDRLIDFMKHDRVTLAGTMLSVGILYAGLAWYGIRRGKHWAQQAVIYSAFAGFFTFFFFLGFGYFDPFHAFVTTILFQFLLLTIYARLPATVPESTLDLRNDAKWKMSQWGQLIYIVHGAVLIVAGAVISKVGMTSVFVPEDMEFLCTTPDNLLNANPQLVPLVAHDRATFGGMLIATGIVVHLASLWGFRRGERWLWWTLLIAGVVPYLATIWVHTDVGYTSFKHLLPAYGGLIGLIVGSALSHGYLCDTAGHAIEK